MYHWEYYSRRSSVVVSKLFKNPMDQKGVRLAFLTRGALSTIQKSMKARIVLGDPTMEKAGDRKSPSRFANDFLNSLQGMLWTRGKKDPVI